MALLGPLRELMRRYPGDDAIARGLRHLASLPPDFLPDAAPGFTRRDEVEGSRLFALHQAYLTKPLAEARLEGHRRHADLQYLHRGSERSLYAPLAGQAPGTPYDADKDVEFYPPEPSSDFLIRPGMVAIFFPEDLHAPSLHPDGRNFVLKTVMKVLLDARDG